MAGLDVAVPEVVGRFRGEQGLENEPVYIGLNLNKGTNAARAVAEADTFVARIQAVLGRLDELVSPGEKLDRDRLEAIIEFAAWAHSEWVRIHPFCNSNGRIARVLSNAIFLRYGLPPVLRLRPRPSSPYSYAGAEGMNGNSKPMEALLRRLLKEFPNQD